MPDQTDHPSPDLEDRIRRKAHEIWEREGRPEGREAEHWYKAQDFVNRETFEATVGTPNAAAEAVDFWPAAASDNVAAFQRGVARASVQRKPVPRHRPVPGPGGVRPIRAGAR